MDSKYPQIHKHKFNLYTIFSCMMCSWIHKHKFNLYINQIHKHKFNVILCMMCSVLKTQENGSYD
jgi:hypothetical protein